MLGLAAALGAGAALCATPEGGSEMYRCPGNDYKNTICAKEAEKLGCKTIEGAPITIIQTVKPRPRHAPCRRLRGRSSPAGARIDPAGAARPRQRRPPHPRGRAARPRRTAWPALQKDFNNGEPERQGNEQNYQKYLDRVAEMKRRIARKESDIAALRRELQKLPPPRTQ